MNQQRIIEITADGSHTLFVPGMNEHYHSVNGAIQESTHVFINAGLKHSAKNPVRILEIGFGTGLNALLTLAEVYRNRELAVEYYTMEAYPLLPEVIKQLNYSEQLEGVPAGCFSQLHAVPWDQAVQIIPGFILYKMKGDANTLPFPAGRDLVYYDEFAPETQPDIW
ncbi:MAG: SAM-dependent methyltransferase, partial [Tannerellaceae bacterium]|nr:SAM-dependent methyltransferase [Tannerellaceae bacterium]